MSGFISSVSRRVTDITSSTTSSSQRHGQQEREYTSSATNSASKITSSTPNPKGMPSRPPTDAEKLMSRLHVSSKEAYWFERVHDAIRRAMNKKNSSSCFNFTHIERVVENAYQLWNAEKHHSWAKNIDPLTIFIGAMVYDIGNDDTYALQVFKNGDPTERTLAADEARRQHQVDIVLDFLRTNKCPPAVAGPASHFAALVSFPREMNDTKGVRGQCEDYPALMIVQDAVRLEDLGDAGIRRAHRLHRGPGSADATVVRLMDERFKFYVGLMKTKTGKKEAEKLWREMLKYKDSLWDYKRNCWAFL